MLSCVVPVYGKAIVVEERFVLNFLIFLIFPIFFFVKEECYVVSIPDVLPCVKIKFLILVKRFQFFLRFSCFFSREEKQATSSSIITALTCC